MSDAGTDVMLLDNFSTDGSSHLQYQGNPAGKRRSSVTFEDQVEHSKGTCHFLLRKEETGGQGTQFLLAEVVKNEVVVIKEEVMNAKVKQCSLCH